MSLISLVIVLIIIGALLYVVSLLPIDGTIKKIINIVVIIVVLLWILQLFVGPGFGDIRIGR